VPVNRNPSVRQRRLARTLKQLRNDAGLTMAQVAHHLACAESKISRIEGAQSGVRVVDLRLLLELYGVSSPELRRQLEEMSRDGRLRGWWDRYSDVLSPAYADYISLEADASTVRSIPTLLIPGLLQTEDYTRAMLRVQIKNGTAEQVEALTQVRQRRRSALTRSSPLGLWVVLSESVLKHEIGGRAVMRDQLDYLARAARGENIKVQILPEASDAHASLSIPVTILGFPEATETDVVYVDNLYSTIYIEDQSEVAVYANLFNDVAAASLSPETSITLIERAAKEMD